ncbi:MAG: Rossmann-like and DUF2520 domain-containing protein [Bacteroidota bacterium]
MKIETIGIIGLGNLGQALYQALPGPLLLHDRSPKPFPLASAEEVLEQCSLVFLALPDDQIEAFVRDHQWGKKQGKQGVVHTSGALSLDALEPARRAGVLVGSFHPLQAFRKKANKKSFEGITVGVEAESPLFEALESIALSLGARPRRLEASQKVPYHLAASILSNFTVTLFERASSLIGTAGFSSEEAREMLLPLLEGTLENLRHPQALTGPIARGDERTVRKHLDCLRATPEDHRLYCMLAERTLALAELAPETRERMNHIFKEEALCERS